VDVFRTLHPDDPGLTLPTPSPHVRLDYIFVSRANAGRVIRCEVVRDGTVASASDHFPVIADLDVS
jgi:exodeoxyribonuclease III